MEWKNSLVIDTHMTGQQLKVGDRPVTGVFGHICTHLGPAELLEEAGVGVEAGRVEDRVLSSMEPQEVI